HPKAPAFVEVLRRAVSERIGVLPFLLGTNAHADRDARELGFDGTIAFEPQLGAVTGPKYDGLKIYDYTTARSRMVARPYAYPTYPCVLVGWDNTPRRGDQGIVF